MRSTAVAARGHALAARAQPHLFPPARATAVPHSPTSHQHRTRWWWPFGGGGGRAARRARSLTPARAATVDPDSPDATPLARAHARGETIGFGFSAGGLLFPYYIGTVSALIDLDLIKPESTPLAGASAGSLIAACVAAGLPPPEIEGACLALAEDCRTGGTRGRLGAVLKDFLYAHLPSDAHLAARDRVHVAVTPLTPRGPRPLLVSDFGSRDDLIAALLTSCHIPLWMDGSLTRAFRSGRALDGGLTQFLPLPPGCHGVGVCCFPSVATLGGRLGEGNLISPDAYVPTTADGRDAVDAAAGVGVAGLSLPQLLAYAFAPAPDPVLKALAAKGDADARAWAAAELGVGVPAGEAPGVTRGTGGGPDAVAAQAGAAAGVAAAGEAAAAMATVAAEKK